MNHRKWLLSLLTLASLTLEAFGATTATVTPGDWPLYRGTSIVSRHATLEACVAAAKALNVARAYTCRTTTGVAVTITPDVCTTPQPASETQTVQCPAGTTGSWQQSRSYVAAPFPTCWTAGAWSPATAPAGACTTPPPPPPLITVTAAFNPATITAGQSTSLIWSSTGATSCSAASGSQSMALPSISGSINVDAQSTPLSVIVTCNGVSATARLTIASAPPPPTTSLTVNWSAPATYTDGSPIAAAISYVVRVNGAVAVTTSATTATIQSVPRGSCATVAAVVAGVSSAETRAACGAP